MVNLSEAVKEKSLSEAKKFSSKRPTGTRSQNIKSKAKLLRYQKMLAKPLTPGPVKKIKKAPITEVRGAKPIIGGRATPTSQSKFTQSMVGPDGLTYKHCSLGFND